MAQQACELSVFLQHVRIKGSQAVFIRMKSHLPDSAILTTFQVCFVLLHPAGYLLALSSSADSTVIETRPIDARSARQALKESNPLLQIDQVSIYKELILFSLSPKWIICPVYVDISPLSLPCRIYPVKTRRALSVKQYPEIALFIRCYLLQVLADHDVTDTLSRVR